MKEYFKAIYKLAERCVVKVLKIDLGSGLYKILFMDKRERKPNLPLFDDWVNECCSTGIIHPDYSEGFSKTITTENISKLLKYKKYIHYKFKRSFVKDGEYKMNVLTIILSDDNSCYLIIYDIDE